MRKRKKLPDNQPTETAKEAVEKVEEMLLEIENFCKINNISFVACAGCWDRLTEQEEKVFKFIGPHSSMLGLLAIAGERVSDMAYDEFDTD